MGQRRQQDFDGMSGPVVREHRLWPQELAETAARQMNELALYNTFFKTTTTEY